MTVKGEFEYDYAMREMFTDALKEAAKLIAEKWCAEHYIEVAAKLDPQAIANLVIAKGASEIKKTLEERLPGRVDTIVEREVYQRGLLGGMRRVL
jgi:hypothetical protein